MSPTTSDKISPRRTVAITGAAGNLGSLLARGMMQDDVCLHLLTHRKDVGEDLKLRPHTKVFPVDLAEESSLHQALEGVDCIVHFAGILFQARPEQFLPRTNTGYFRHLLNAAEKAKVKRVILISFPHVEGESSPEKPATGHLNASPNSAHARTRLEEEKMLLSHPHIQGISLRVGMVYGKGILMIEAARLFSRLALLGVWKKPTWIHLISREDFVAATKAAIAKEDASGIYHLGDEGVQTLQEFLHAATKQWKSIRPWTMPIGLIRGAALGFETLSLLTGCPSPLTRDFITIGQQSYYGDTTRMREELLPTLLYPRFQDGIHTLS